MADAKYGVKEGDLMDSRVSPSISNSRVFNTLESNSGNLDNVRTKEAISSTELLHKKAWELTIPDAAFQRALEKVNKALQGIDTKLEYSVHEKSGEIMVKVINQETNEVLREIPPEKFLDLVVKLQELSGIFIDEKR